jgi:hypothetical protein
MKKQSDFSLWLTRKWYEHLDESEAYGVPLKFDSAPVYFRNHKYWLKRQYQLEKSIK